MGLTDSRRLELFSESSRIALVLLIFCLEDHKVMGYKGFKVASTC